MSLWIHICLSPLLKTNRTEFTKVKGTTHTLSFKKKSWRFHQKRRPFRVLRDLPLIAHKRWEVHLRHIRWWVGLYFTSHSNYVHFRRIQTEFLDIKKGGRGLVVAVMSNSIPTQFDRSTTQRLSSSRHCRTDKTIMYEVKCSRPVAD